MHRQGNCSANVVGKKKPVEKRKEGEEERRSACEGDVLSIDVPR